MAKFAQALVRKLENGYVVSITTLELTERGYQPTENHFIAAGDAEVLKLLELDGKATSTVKLETVK